MTPEKEKELLTALSKGNQSAFDSLYLFYAPKVREFVFRLLKNPGEAEDVTQKSDPNYFYGLRQVSYRRLSEHFPCPLLSL